MAVDLKEIVVCPVCQTPHKKRPLLAKQKAVCTVCGAKLYRGYRGVEHQLFSFSLSAIVLFVIALFFPLVGVRMGPLSTHTSVVEAVWNLFEQGYFVVAFFALMALVVYPLLLFVSSFLVAAGMMGRLCAFTQKALMVFGFVMEWSMLDIFLISLIVAMVKVVDYAQVEFDGAFWAMVVVVGIEIYLVRSIGVVVLWERWEELCEA
jgi:paraquat-inducible protein A